MSHLRNTLLVSVLLSSLISCHKSGEDPQPAVNISANNTSHSMAEFLAAHGSPKQVFNVDARDTIRIKGVQGVEMMIPKGWLNGKVDTSRPVQVELTEVFTKKGMILHGRPTSASDGRMLLSQGEFALNIKQDGRLIDTDAQLTIPAKAGNMPDPSFLFVGIAQGNNPDSSPEFAWFLKYVEGSFNTEADTLPLYQVGSQSFYQKMVDLDKFTWFNCDVFRDNTGSSNYLTGTWNSPASVEPKLYVSVEGTPSVGVLYPDGHSFNSKGHYNGVKIPDNLPATLIGYQFENDKFYFGKKTVTTGPGISPRLELKEISEADLVKELDALQ